jgi:tetratricopeptide (TPR) repeat protein
LPLEMDTKRVIESGTADLANCALTLFQKGKWAQALPLLQQADQDCHLSAEILAALGICLVFSKGPLVAGEDWSERENLEQTDDLLRQAETSGWSEVSACKAWLQLLHDKNDVPGKAANALEILLNAGRKSSWFPIWSLAFRALAYYDRRQALRDLLTPAVENLENISPGLALVFAEACLECADPLSIGESMLQNVDAQNCLPLAPDVANLWQQWLLAEFTWWKEGKPGCLEGFQTQLADFLQNPPPEIDPYSKKELKRLTFRSALLCARCALAQGKTSKAREWIELVSRDSTGLWEIEYLQGMIAWCRKEYQNARIFLEKSLILNPFQSRVRFELAMLISSQDTSNTGNFPFDVVPGVHDMVAGSALVLFRSGRDDKAPGYLEQLEKPEMPYSLFLVWPRARILRIQQGKELRAYMAEANKNWLEAIKGWDEVRMEDSPVTDLAHRAHRLYLLGRYLEQTGRSDDFDKKLYTRFHKELGKLAIRTLTGEAMFYRGLAAERHMPERAQADWRAVLRQYTWLEKTQMTAPGRLLALGDRLLKAGFKKDAHKAYQRVNDTSITGVPARKFLSGLINQSPTGADVLLKSPEAGWFLPDHSLLLFLQGLCILAKEQPDLAAASSLLKEAQQFGLPASLARISEILPSLLAGQPDAERQLCSFLDETMPEDFPLKLRVGLEILGKPNGVESLRRFKEAFEDNWKTWLPISPEDILGKQLQEYYTQGDYKGALDQIKEAENMGLKISDEWKAFLLISQAVGIALNGDFDTAEKTRQQALNILSPDLASAKSVMKKNE